jgi:hypothetical protein
VPRLLLSCRFRLRQVLMLRLGLLGNLHLGLLLHRPVGGEIRLARDDNRLLFEIVRRRFRRDNPGRSGTR